MKRFPAASAPRLRLMLLTGCALLSPSHAETPLERGRYLVQSISACANCHTQQGPQGPLAGKQMAGGMAFDDPAFKAYAPNLTPDRATGVGSWTDAQLITAIREGKRPDGSVIGPPMPVAQYRGISDRDVAAMVVYLRSLPAVPNRVPRSRYKFALPASYGPPAGKVAEVSRADRLAYGRYLAGPLGHCVECHSAPGADGAPDTKNNLGTGGLLFKGPWGMSVSSNITPSNLARYNDAQLKKIITTGVRPDGSHLKPPMGTSFYARMSGADLDALVAYLRQLPRK